MLVEGGGLSRNWTVQSPNPLARNESSLLLSAPLVVVVCLISSGSAPHRLHRGVAAAAAAAAAASLGLTPRTRPPPALEESRSAPHSVWFLSPTLFNLFSTSLLCCLQPTAGAATEANNFIIGAPHWWDARRRRRQQEGGREGGMYGGDKIKVLRCNRQHAYTYISHVIYTATHPYSTTYICIYTQPDVFKIKAI